MALRACHWFTAAVAVASLGLPAFSGWPVAAAPEQVPSPVKQDPNQNKSAADDWNLGEYFRDRDYKVGLPVQNNCKIAQTVTLEYPKTLPLKGPASVTVPAHHAIVVDMVLELAKPAVRPPPYPPGTVFNCHLVKDQLTLTHQETKEVTRRDGGRETYTCFETQKIYAVSAFIHEHGSPDPPNEGGGGGKKKPNAVCSLLWNHGEFFPSPSKPEPGRCLDEIRQEALDFFGPELEPIRKLDQSAWAWAPKPLDIGHLSTKELLELKALADKQARTKK